MHVPDGFLDTKTWLSLGGLAGLSVAAAARAAAGSEEEQRVPMMGVVAAFVFAAQLINVPIGFGVSGHFMGATLVAVVLGPFTAVLIMSTVLFVQCLLFQDGGITALGANIVNMAVVGAFSGYFLYKVFSRFTRTPGGRFAGTAVAAWSSIVLTAAACAVELSFSGTAPLKAVLPALAGIYGAIGIGEGIITAAILAALYRIRPDILELKKI